LYLTALANIITLDPTVIMTFETGISYIDSIPKRKRGQTQSELANPFSEPRLPFGSKRLQPRKVARASLPTGTATSPNLNSGINATKLILKN
jgi:hypothetical protein